VLAFADGVGVVLVEPHNADRASRLPMMSALSSSLRTSGEPGRPPPSLPAVDVLDVCSSGREGDAAAGR